MRTIACVIGTRPEVIKMAPVVKALAATSWAAVEVITSGQHRQMLDQAMAHFGLQADRDLDVMREGQSLSSLTGNLFHAIEAALAECRPEAVLAQGDTTTVMVTAIVCFYLGIPFCHVEAGLRTGNLRNPFPEEFNRVAAGRVAALHFAPTERARAALRREGIDPARIHVTGNTVIDALLETAARLPVDVASRGPHILLTTHRRESFGEPMSRIFDAVSILLDRFADLRVTYPVHPNPAVKALAEQRLGGHPQVNLCQPLDYPDFVSAMKSATLILSDSGGVQEEAPALGKPVLVLREETERPEAIEAGGVLLVGSDTRAIVAQASRLLAGGPAFVEMSQPRFPYGDGLAARRIVDILGRYLGGGIAAT